MEKEVFELLKKTKMIKSLEMRGYLQKVDNEWLITEKLQDVLNDVNDDSWIEGEYREKFSSANTGEPGKMGTLSNVIMKMKRFMLTYPEVTKELILEATDLYIANMTNRKYLKQADYFIFKIEQSGDEQSLLSVWVEEAKQQDNKSEGKPII